MRRKLQGLLLGTAMLLLVALASLWITLAWLFARVPGLVYDLAPWQGSALHMLYEGFVTPIANKFIVPLLLALGYLSFWWRRPAIPGAPSPAPPARLELARDVSVRGAPPARSRSRHGRKR